MVAYGLCSPIGLPVLPSVLLRVSLAAPLGLPFLCPFPLHALWPHAFRARYPTSTSLVAHDQRPRISADTSTSTPCTTLAWMNTFSPVGAVPKPKPLSTNHLFSFTTLVSSAKASSRLSSRSSSSSWDLSLSSLSSLLVGPS